MSAKYDAAHTIYQPTLSNQLMILLLGFMNVTF